MKRQVSMFAIAVLICAAAGQAVAGPVVLWNTGEDGVGGVLPNGSTELHYNLFDAGGNPLPDPIVTENSAWLDAPAGSQWISLSHPPTTAPFVVYKYQLTFTLDALPTDDLMGLWATDDADVSLGYPVIYLNGSPATGTGVTGANFWELTPFAIDGGFVVGLNTLEFRVSNEVGHAITGLLVSGLNFPTDPVIPAPAALVLVALGTGAVGYLRRRSLL